MAKPKRTYTGKQYIGIVKWFSDDKGYGFITGQDGEDHFMHWSALVMNGHRTIPKGQEVTFYIEKSDTGRMHAVGVTAIELNA